MAESTTARQYKIVEVNSGADLKVLAQPDLRKQIIDSEKKVAEFDASCYNGDSCAASSG